MIYFSLDVETTGLDPSTCQLLTLALVREDTEHPEIPVSELPALHIAVSRRVYTGDPYALGMHAELWKKLAARQWGKRFETPCVREKLIDDQELSLECVAWLRRHGVTPTSRAWLAGKNAGSFDLRFAEFLRPYFHHRVLDPGSVFWDAANAGGIDSLDALSMQLGFPGVEHDALSDARRVIEVLRCARTRMFEDPRR